MTDHEKFRRAQAQKMLDLYEGANGRLTSTKAPTGVRLTNMKELAEWMASPEGGAGQRNP